MINYSVIIPHYNIPDLLIRCIRSIPLRDDVEIIVVDDNSPDGAKYKEKYSDLSRKNLTYIHLDKNEGGGKARNVGIKYARGKWLVFADADDFFNYCINDLFDDFAYSPCDIIFFNANSVDTETYVNVGRSLPQNKRISSYISFKDEKSEYMLRYDFGEPWCKFVKRELVEQYHIRFEEVPIHNDARFCYLIGYYAQTVDADPRAAYCVTDRLGSVSRVIDADRYLTRLKVFVNKYSFLKSKGFELDPVGWYFIYNSIGFFYENNLEDHLRLADKILSEQGIELKDVIAEHKKSNKRNQRNRFKNKIVDRATKILKGILLMPK